MPIDSEMSLPTASNGVGDDTTTKMMPGRKTLEQMRSMLNDFRYVTENNNTQGLIDYDYYDGKQLTADERNELRRRKQPDIVVNRSKVAINGILGIVAKSHTDPKAWPRGPNDQDSASVATDVLRYVTQKNFFNRKKVECFKDNLIGGSCAILIGVRPDKDVPLTRIRWEEFVYDPRSREVNFSDARYMGIAKWMYQDDVKAAYPGKVDDYSSDANSFAGGIGSASDQQQDRPLNQGWLDQRNKRVMVVEMYYRVGEQWMKCVFWYNGILEEGVSPYKNEYGIPSCPIEAVSCYVDRDNNRYGALRDMRDLQDEINKRRSKLLHLINSSQIQARDPSAIEVDSDTAREEAARPDGVLPYGWEKVSTQDMAQGQMLLLTEAKNEMERFGPNPAVLGRQGSDTSGRALLARQQAGMIELAVVLDQIEEWEQRVYRAIWCRVKQFWKAPQFIRVTDDIEAPTFVGINQPIPNPQAGQPVMGPDGQPQMVPVPGQDGQPQVGPDGQPVMGQAIHGDILGYTNNVAEMDVDIVIDTAPATATIMQEQLQDLMKLIGSNPTYAQQVPFEVFLELMPIPRKRQIIKQIQELRAKQEAAGQKQQEMNTQIAVNTALAKLRETESKTELNQARVDQVHADIQKTAIETHTGTMEALHDMTTPEGAPEEPDNIGGA